jgi:hypothetical protein
MSKKLLLPDSLACQEENTCWHLLLERSFDKHLLGTFHTSLGDHIICYPNRDSFEWESDLSLVSAPRQQK